MVTVGHPVYVWITDRQHIQTSLGMATVGAGITRKASWSPNWERENIDN